MNHNVSKRLPRLPARNVYASHFVDRISAEPSYGMTPHLERIGSREDCHHRHVKDGNCGANDPCFKVQTPEPILLHRTRVENEEPKTEFWAAGLILVRRSSWTAYLQDG